MEPEQKSNGALVGLIIVIIILVLGGIYLWRNSVKERENLENAAVTSNAENANDDTASLEADVNKVELEDLDSEI